MKLNNFRAGLAAATLSVVGLGTASAADAQSTVVRQTVANDTSRLSPDLLSLGKLVQAGLDDKVVVTYIQNSPPSRNPTAEELVYLHELGLSSEAMVALMNSVPKVSLVETQSTAAPSSERIVEPLLAQRAYQPGGTVQTTPVVTQAPAQSPAVSGSTVISAPAPSVVYTQQATPPIIVQQQPVVSYVEQPPVVTYVEPVRPRVSFSFGFGHVFGHHDGGHFGHHRSHHWGGHHGGHWGGHHGGHGGRH